MDVLPEGFVDLNCLVSGDDDSSSELQIDLTDIPDTAKVCLRILNRLCAGADLIGMSFSKPNSREVHKRTCEWVGRMHDKNKRGFRSLANAHNAGYDNCAYCIGDSDR